MTNFLVPSVISDILFENSASIPNNTKGSVTLDDAIFQVDFIRRALEANAIPLGINLQEVVNIVDFNKDAKGVFSIYYPSIKNVDGKACLVWGKLVKDLTTFTLKPSFTGDKAIFAEFDLPSEPDSEEVSTFAIPLRTKKDLNPALTAGSARTLFNRGKLHEVLADGFGAFSPPVTGLDAGKYNIIAAKQVAGYKGAVSFDITLAQYGTFKAPNKVVQKLNSLGTDAISESTPWTMTLGELKTTKGSGGNDITYRDVVHVGTSNLSNLDLSQFKFSYRANNTEERLPNSLLDLDVE